MTRKSLRYAWLPVLLALAVLLAAFLLLRNSKAEEPWPRSNATQRELILHSAPEPDLDTDKEKGAVLLLEVLINRNR